MSIYSVLGDMVNAAYNLSELLDYAYDINGNIIYESEYTNYTVTTLFNYPQSSMQGFAVYDGKIAQVKENAKLHIINLSTGRRIREVTMDMGHGNSCQFSDEFYAEGDEFPLFYIRNSGIWVYRIVNTSSELVKKYSFSADDIGTYVAGFGIDTQNDILYTASYTTGNYQTKDGLLRICKFDMTSETENEDGTFSFELLSSNDLTYFDRFNAIQGSCYHGGVFYIAAGYVNTTQYIIMIDPATLTYDQVLPITPNKELEGCAWVDEDDYLLIGQKTNTYDYKKLEFTSGA